MKMVIKMYEDILSNLIIKNIRSVTTSYSNKNASGKRNNRERWSLVIKFEGETHYFSQNETIVSNGNSVMILPKSSTYEWKCIEAGRFAAVEFEMDYEYNKVFSIETDDMDRILDKIRSMEHKRLVKSPMYISECIRDTYDILISLFSPLEKKYIPSSKIKKIQPAIDYISENFHRNIKNDYLAKLSGISTVYFRKIFTEYFNMSPVTYIHTLRIRKAKEMLKSDYSSITDIALSLGYINIYDFSRDFKKHTGMAPSTYASKQY